MRIFLLGGGTKGYGYYTTPLVGEGAPMAISSGNLGPGMPEGSFPHIRTFAF